MQNPEEIDWDYEWTYTSGELPQNDNLFKSINSNISFDDNGLLLPLTGIIFDLVDKQKALYYIEFTPNYNTINLNDKNTNGFMLNFYFNETELPTIVFNCNSVLAYRPSTATEDNVSFNMGKPQKILLYFDTVNTTDSYYIFNGVKYFMHGKKSQYFDRKSFIAVSVVNVGMTGKCTLQTFKFKEVV